MLVCICLRINCVPNIMNLSAKMMHNGIVWHSVRFDMSLSNAMLLDVDNFTRFQLILPCKKNSFVVFQWPYQWIQTGVVKVLLCLPGGIKKAFLWTFSSNSILTYNLKKREVEILRTDLSFIHEMTSWKKWSEPIRLLYALFGCFFVSCLDIVLIISIGPAVIRLQLMHTLHLLSCNCSLVVNKLLSWSQGFCCMFCQCKRMQQNLQRTVHVFHCYGHELYFLMVNVIIVGVSIQATKPFTII